MQQQRQNKDLYKFPTERTKGIIATIIFHVIIVVVLIVSGFKTPLPLPEEEGILVNFGYDETGSGLLEPSSSSSQSALSATEEEGAGDNVAEIVEEVSETTEAVAEAEVENMTQEFEEAPVVEKKIEKPDPVEEARKKAEAEAKAKAEAEAKLKAKAKEAARLKGRG